MTSPLTYYNSPHPFPLSKAVAFNNLVFLSGQVPINAKGEFIKGSLTTQTRAVLTEISQTLAEINSSLSQVIKVTVWLANIDDFDEFNAVYKEFFKHPYPARSTVQARLAHDVEIEIEVIAYKND